MPSLKTRIALTDKCANNCWYCYSPKGDRVMSRELFVQIIDKLKAIFDNGRYSRLNIGFSGGDPFQGDLIVEAQHIVKRVFGDAVDFTFSSVSRTSDLDVVCRYFDAGGRAYYSLNEDPLDEVEERLSYLRSRWPHTGLFFLFTEFNLSRLDSILELIVKHQLPFRMNHLYDVDNALGEDAIIEGIDRTFAHMINAGHPIKMLEGHAIFGAFNKINHTTQYCGYGRNYYHFSATGEVSRCQCEPPVSTVDDPNLEQTIKTRIDYGECLDCEAFFLCRGGCIYANRKRNYCRVYKRLCWHLKTYYKAAIEKYMRAVGLIK